MNDHHHKWQAQKMPSSSLPRKILFPKGTVFLSSKVQRRQLYWQHRDCYTCYNAGEYPVYSYHMPGLTPDGLLLLLLRLPCFRSDYSTASKCVLGMSP